MAILDCSSYQYVSRSWLIHARADPGLSTRHDELAHVYRLQEAWYQVQVLYRVGRAILNAIFCTHVHCYIVESL